LRDIEFFVLDEADRMLDMGFVHDVKKIISKLPTKRQTLFFSATMPPEIQRLADALLTNPVKVEVTPVSSTVEAIQQSLYFVEKQNKKSLLVHLLRDRDIRTALVFSRTKHGADKIARGLNAEGIRAEAIHGNKSQNARQLALSNFKSKKIRVLVATDIAARGIDIDELSHVFNHDLPDTPETYVHRIGRTGRAGASGIAISFCDADERAELKDIQKLINKNIPVVDAHPFAVTHMGQVVKKTMQQKSAAPRKGYSQNGARNRQGRPGANRRHSFQGQS
jgi:ATP-dependent RNA helicase RhlE